VLAGVAGFTATTSGTPDWLRGLEQAMVAAPAVGLVSGISAQRRAFVSWRRSPWTALRVDADGLTVTAHARTHARDATSTYTVAWDLVEQVGVSGNGAASWVVVWFVAGTFPTSAEASAWAQERGAQLRYPGDPGVLNLCQPARGAGEDEAERIVARARGRGWLSVPPGARAPSTSTGSAGRCRSPADAAAEDQRSAGRTCSPNASMNASWLRPTWCR
jgi:hypothetical protein